MRNKDQEQNVTQGSTAIQAGGDINITKSGLTYTEVREVAMDVFHANFIKLAGVARTTAKQRAEEITELFLSRLQKENPDVLDEVSNPNFQYGLFTIQKEYARNGNREIGDLLINLLIERSKQTDRDILQITMNESLNIVPRLTQSQLAALSLIFIFRYYFDKNSEIKDSETFHNFLIKYVEPFSSTVIGNYTCYQHLTFTGCGLIGEEQRDDLVKIIERKYPGLFSHGFSKTAEIARLLDLESDLFKICPYDSEKLQVDAANFSELEKSVKNRGLYTQQREMIKLLYRKNLMYYGNFEWICVRDAPFMQMVFEVWRNSPIAYFRLTNVGIMIGYANIKRFAGEFTTITNWIY